MRLNKVVDVLQSSWNYTLIVSGRREVEDTRLEAKAKNSKKNQRPRPKTALPRTDPFEAKDRHARGQGPRTERESDLQKKKGLCSKISYVFRKIQAFSRQ